VNSDTDRKALAAETEKLHAEKQRLKNEAREGKDALVSKAAAKSFDVGMLGNGLAKGGNAAHRMNRIQLLHRVRLQFKPLLADLANDWEWFIDRYDRNSAGLYDKVWGSKFLQQMDALLKSENKNTSNELEAFIHRHIKALKIQPAIKI
jgi:hypothetical protein